MALEFTYLSRRLMAKFSGNVPKDKQRAMVSELGMGRTPASVLRFLAQRCPIKLDFHNMSSGQMLRWIRKAPRASKGDLDVIVARAVQKDPARRYASVEQFAADIQRFLDGYPVLARQGDIAYRTRKFIVRNRTRRAEFDGMVTDGADFLQRPGDLGWRPGEITNGVQLGGDLLVFHRLKDFARSSVTTLGVRTAFLS